MMDVVTLSPLVWLPIALGLVVVGLMLGFYLAALAGRKILKDNHLRLDEANRIVPREDTHA